MRMLVVMVAAMVFLSGAARAAPLPDLSWLSGDWRRCQDGEIVEERWLGPRGGLLIGANLTSSQGKASFENLRIAASDGAWTYWAAPMGRTPVPFRLVEAGAAARRVRQSRSTAFRRGSSTGAKATSCSRASKGRSRTSRRRSSGASRRERRPTVRSSSRPDLDERRGRARCRFGARRTTRIGDFAVPRPPGLRHDRLDVLLAPLARPRRRLPRRPHGRARRDHRQRRAAVDPRRPRLQRDDAGLGRQRLPAHLRRLPPPRRPARRPVRPSPRLPGRHRRLHRRLARLRPGDRASAARDRARRAGHRRRDRRRGRARPADAPVHRGRRARQGDGRVRLRLRRRRLDRRAARRRPHRRLRLALGLPRQPADRRRRRRPQPRPPAGAPARRRRGRASTSPARSR